MADCDTPKRRPVKRKSTSSVGVKGKTLHSQAREVVHNVCVYLEKSAGDDQGKMKLWKATEAATGVGYSTVRRIMAGKTATDPDANDDSSQAFSTPGKNRPRKAEITDLDTFDLGVMKRKIQDCYIRKELPTLRSLHAMFVREINFKGSVASLRYVLRKKLGLRYKKSNSRKILLERSEIVSQRRQYLRLQKSLEPGRSIIYLDETWVNEHHNVGFCWQDGKDISGPVVPLGKGKRLILCHAGSRNGFVPNALLLFCSKTKSEDYHDEMNGEVFLKWFTEQLLPNIPPNSVIVMDNASYHSVRSEPVPTMRNRKAEMQEWLTTHQIPWSLDLLKPELYQLVKLYKPRELRYVIDDLAKEHGHTMLRLPPYHCDLNPIELIWAQVKNYIARKNTTHKLADVRELTKVALNAVSAENWKKACEHVRKIEAEYWEKDALMDVVLEPLIISLSESSSESDSDISDSDDFLGCVPFADDM